MTLDPVRTDTVLPGTSRVPLSKLFGKLSNLSVPTLVVGICAIHIALLLWQAYAVQINNDGILYVTAARRLAQGDIAGARAQFPWLGYPALIAGVVTATGLDPVIAARLLNGIASTLTVLLILRAAWAALPGRTTLLCAAALLFGNLWFNELRGTIVREHFYFLFVLCGFYCLLRDLQSPGVSWKAGFVVVTAIAALFRIEAVGFLIFVPALRLALEPRPRMVRVVAFIVLLGGPACAVAVLAYWSDLGNVAALLAKPLARIAALRDQVLWPYEFRKAGFAYASMIAGLWLYALINSIGLPVLALVGVGAATSATFRRSAPLYLALIYVAVGAVALFVQAFFNLFLDPRHGLVLSLMLTVPAAVAFVNLLPEAADQARRWPRIVNGFVVVMLVVGFFGGMKYYDARRYQITAGQWLAENVASNAHVIGNNNQVQFYGGLATADPDLVISSSSHALPISDARDWKSYDVVVLELRKDQLDQVPALEKNIGQPPTKSFENSRGDKILIFKLR